MAVQATYKLEVDWNNDGDFDDAGEDISADWIDATIRRGFASPLARVPAVGRARFRLRNSAQAYSPPLEAGVVPMLPVQFTMTYGITSVVLFRGFIEEIRPDFGTKLQRQAVLECVDAISMLDRYEGEVALQTDVYADDLIEDVVAAVYTPPDTDYDEGVNLFPTSCDRWSYGPRVNPDNPGGAAVENVRAMDKILDCCTADWGRFFVKGDGTAAYYNRHHMPLEDTITLTLDNTMVAMGYRKADDTIFNYVQVTCNPREIGQTREVLGEISGDDPPRIEASADITLTLRFRDPSNTSRHIGGLSCLTPVATTDYECTDDEGGEGTDVTTDVTPTATFYGDYAEIKLENTTAAPVWVQKLQVRGYAVRAREPVTVTAQDATSIAAYGKRKLTLNVPLMSWTAHAQSLADYLLAVYKDPQHDVHGVSFIANSDATRLSFARDLDLLDRVSITETQTGLSAFLGHVYALEHVINSKWHHVVTMDLETPYDVGTPFRLDTSALNSGHVLIY